MKESETFPSSDLIVSPLLLPSQKYTILIGDWGKTCFSFSMVSTIGFPSSKHHEHCRIQSSWCVQDPTKWGTVPIRRLVVTSGIIPKRSPYFSFWNSRRVSWQPSYGRQFQFRHLVWQVRTGALREQLTLYMVRPRKDGVGSYCTKLTSNSSFSKETFDPDSISNLERTAVPR